MATIRKDSESKRKTSKQHPPRTIEEAEKQNIMLAMQLARTQLENGTASAQLITHFVKLGSVKAEYDLENLKQSNILLTAKSEAIKSQQNSEKMYADAIAAMKKYNGEIDDEGREDY